MNMNCGWKSNADDTFSNAVPEIVADVFPRRFTTVRWCLLKAVEQLEIQTLAQKLKSYSSSA
jgi:hypothetical protein